MLANSFIAFVAQPARYLPGKAEAVGPRPGSHGMRDQQGAGDSYAFGFTNGGIAGLASITH